MTTYTDSAYHDLATGGGTVEVVGPDGAELLMIYAASGVTRVQTGGGDIAQGGPVPAGAWVAVPCAVALGDAPGLGGTGMPVLTISADAATVTVRFTRGGLS